ncbi:sigma-54-dependent transcriptional regulator [Wenzhouxiangella limi]|uniref:Sigma-54-dependent Fis family transcriptional regulator n=1 Tax=Wenzhouxiangella limi TaxID=2707351 RepID=A0A845UWT7_9GAMM|nr:sigma-54 dependent transcriptional regulator [Wenzhouxiangella limi]NDY95897.1 sigma-54-dependent Fis family transcriptional regulator [Wenzhouxiangella limi]
MAGARILIVDDEPDIRELIVDILQDEGHQVCAAADAAQAREQRRSQTPELILLDVWMPDTDGISLLREWRDAQALDCPVVMISGHGSVETAVEATRLGAYDFIEKPVSMAKLLVTVNNALEAGRLKRENAGLKQRAPSVMEPLGRSLAVQNLRRRLEKVAAHDAPVLITGEPGVGKQQAARWIHAHSRRAQGPFVAAPTRIEAQGWRNLLLGSAGEPGLLAQAQGGVLFINDITLLDASAQSLLLRILESGHLEPDSSTSSELDIRIITGAGAGLADLVRSGRIDESLYYRLNVLPLEIPPLRERQEDVPDLVRFYAEYFPSRDGLPYRHFSVAAQNRLRQHRWPGNLRELRNLVQRLLILGGDEEVSVAEIDEALAQVDAVSAGPGQQIPALFRLPLREAREEFERQYLTHQLKLAEGSVGKLAEAVEMERTHLYRKLRQLGIDPKQV